MGTGWAYVGLPDSTAGAQGAVGAVQYHTGSGGLSGSKAFLVTDVDIGVPGDTARVAISGTLTVDGVISASHLHIENVTEIDATGSTYFGNTNDDLHARTGSLAVSTLSTTIFYATASANAATPYFGIGTTAPTVTLDVAGDIEATGYLQIDGNTTLGNASGDTVTINAQTINPANIAAGTDNSVVVYNGSSLVTDEIDSRVWGSTLVDATNGTDNELAIFTDSNSVEGDSNLTWSGTALNLVGDITASIGIKADFFEGDGSRLTDVTGAPAGADTQVQFNDGGSAFGADSGFTYNESGTAKLSTGLDIVSDGDFNLLTTVGASNSITVGGASSTVAVAGALTVTDSATVTGDIAATDIAGVNISGSGEISGSSFNLYSEALGALTNTLDLTAPNARGTYLQVRNTLDRIRLTGSAVEVSGAIHNDQSITIGSDEFQTTLGVSGSIAAGVRRVTANWTVDNGTAGSGYDDYIIGVSASGPVTITLPDAASYKGRTIIIKDEYGDGGTARGQVNAITASAAGGNYIEREPATTYGLYGTNQGSFTVYSDGINIWYVI